MDDIVPADDEVAAWTGAVRTTDGCHGLQRLTVENLLFLLLEFLVGQHAGVFQVAESLQPG